MIHLSKKKKKKGEKRDHHKIKEKGTQPTPEKVRTYARAGRTSLQKEKKRCKRVIKKDRVRKGRGGPPSYESHLKKRGSQPNKKRSNPQENQRVRNVRKRKHSTILGRFSWKAWSMGEAKASGNFPSGGGGASFLRTGSLSGGGKGESGPTLLNDTAPHGKSREEGEEMFSAAIACRGTGRKAEVKVVKKENTKLQKKSPVRRGEGTLLSEKGCSEGPLGKTTTRESKANRSGKYLLSEGKTYESNARPARGVIFLNNGGGSLGCRETQRSSHLRGGRSERGGALSLFRKDGRDRGDSVQSRRPRKRP